MRWNLSIAERVCANQPGEKELPVACGHPGGTIREQCNMQSFLPVLIEVLCSWVVR